MSKKHKEKHLEIEGQKSAKFSFIDKKVFLLVFCILGALIIGAIIGMFFPFNYSKQPSQAQECKPSEESTGKQLSLDELKAKVKNFVENSDTIYFQTSSLKDNGFSIDIKNVEKFNNEFYLVSFDVLKEGKVEGSTHVYVSMDGNEIVFGQIMGLGEPLEYKAPPAPEPVKTEKPSVKMFVMSFCPYGRQAEKGLKPVIELLGEKIDFEPHFVIYSNYASGYPDYCIDENSQYCSMHGIKELNEDIRQLCIWKYNKELFWNYVSKVNENCPMDEIETCWKQQGEAVGIDIDKIQQCFENEALELLAKEVELNKQYNVRGSPTILINETEYQGGRAPEDYKQGICNAFIKAPTECEKELGASTGSASGQC